MPETNRNGTSGCRARARSRAAAPSKSATVVSARMRLNPPCRERRKKVFRVWTRFVWQGMPGIPERGVNQLRVRWVALEMDESQGLSHLYVRAQMVMPTVQLYGWRLQGWFVDHAPEHTEFFDGFEKLMELNRFDHVGIGAERITFRQIPLFLGRR